MICLSIVFLFKKGSIMAEKGKRSRKRKLVKRDAEVSPKAGEPVTGRRDDNDAAGDYGGLPQVDLKKNLGCG